MATIVLAGDVMLGRGVTDALLGRPAEQAWSDVLPLLLGADLRIVNLECAITSHRDPWSRTEKVFHFRADPSMVSVLRAARIDACSLANNHILDFEEQGLLDTLRSLGGAGILSAGAGRNSDEAARPIVLTTGGTCPLRVGLVAFTDNEPAFAATAERPGTNYVPVSLDDETLGRVDRAINAARLAGADVVVFSNHWGPNMVQRPSRLFREFARKVVDLGADIYHGHSAHVFQGVELYRGKAILYDTGDLLDDYMIDPYLHNDWSFLFRISTDKCCLKRIELLPLKLSFARVGRAAGWERDAMLTRMVELSRELRTPFARREDRLSLEVD